MNLGPMAESETKRRARPGRPGRVAAATLLVVVVLSACGERDPTAQPRTPSRQEFVEVVVALREAERAVRDASDPDSAAAAFEERKEEILERYGTTDAALRRFVERLHARPAVMAEVWDTIAQRLRREAEPEPERRRPPVVEEPEGD